MKTENRDVSITIDELRDATVRIVEVLGANALTRLSTDQAPLVHAYLLGCVLRAARVAPRSIPTVLQFVDLGYNDYGDSLAADIDNTPDC